MSKSTASGTSATHYCEHCEDGFTAEAGGKLRCPSCLRSTGITPLDPDQGPARKVSKGAVVALVSFCLVIGGVIWFVSTRPTTDPEQAPPAGSTVVDGTGGPALPEPKPPEPAAIDASASPEVAALAKTLIGSAATPSARLRALVSGLHQRIEPADPAKPLRRDVMLPAQAAKALSESLEAKVTLTGIEAGALTLALAKALNVDAAPVVVTQEQAGKTSFRHRDIAAKLEAPGFAGVYAPHRSTEAMRNAPAPATPAAVNAHLRALEGVRKAEELRFDEAAELIGKAIGEAPDDQAFHFLRGHLLVVRGQLEAGLDMMEAAVARSEDAMGRYQLALGFLRAEQKFKAFRALRRAVELDPKLADAWNALGQLTLVRLMESPEEQHEDIKKELKEIETALMAIDKLAPGLIELRIQLLLLEDKKDDAQELAVEALNLQPERSSLHMLAADMALQDGNEAKAQRHLERAAEYDAENPEPLIRLARMYAGKQENDKAIDALRKATERAPHDPDLLMELASGLQQLGRNEEALAAAEMLRDRFPHLPDGYAMLAQFAMAQGQGAEAVKLVEKAIERSPKDAELYVLGYFLNVAEGNKEGADKVVERLVAFEPQGRIMIAQTLLQSGQLEAAVALMEDQLKATPRDHQVAISLAQLYRLNNSGADVERLRKHVADNGGDKAEEQLKLFDEAITEIDQQAGGLPDDAPEGGEPEAP